MTNACRQALALESSFDRPRQSGMSARLSRISTWPVSRSA